MKLGEAPPDAEQLHARRMEAMRLRSKHYTYEEIGQALGISAMQAYRDCKARLAEIVAEETASTEEYRQLELDRLDRIGRRLESFVDRENPSLDHVDAYLKLMARRAKLLGLEAPQKKQLEIEDKRRPQLADHDVLARLKVLHQRLLAAGVKSLPAPPEVLEAQTAGIREPQTAVIDAELVPDDPTRRDESG